MIQKKSIISLRKNTILSKYIRFYLCLDNKILDGKMSLNGKIFKGSL